MPSIHNLEKVPVDIPGVVLTRDGQVRLALLESNKKTFLLLHSYTDNVRIPVEEVTEYTKLYLRDKKFGGTIKLINKDEVTKVLSLILSDGYVGNKLRELFKTELQELVSCIESKDSSNSQSNLKEENKMGEEFIVFGVTYQVCYTYRYNPQLSEDELTIETINGVNVYDCLISEYTISAIEDAIRKFENEKAEDSALGL